MPLRGTAPSDDEVDVEELRRGFVSDDEDSVCAVVNGGDEAVGATREETSSLLESGKLASTARNGGSGSGGGSSSGSAPAEGRAFSALKTLLVAVGVILVMAFAVAGGGYYTYGGGQDGHLSSVSTDGSDATVIKLSDSGGSLPTADPTRAPNAGMGYMTETDDIDYTKMSETEQKELFDLFISLYQKSYDDDEDTMSRFSKFKNNLKLIDERNAAERAMGGSAVHGITKFSDYSDDEFRAAFLTASANGASSGAIMTEVPSYTGDASSVSWEGLYTKGIVDQGYCGACWAYSVTEQMQADAIRMGLITLNVTLSAQQILSCDTASFGCAGGWTERAYQYVQSVGGVALDKDYPYQSYYDMTGTCRETPEQFFMTTDGYYTVNGEQAMIDYVKSTGPLSACVDASTWATYVKGVVSVCGSTVDHCVQIIGINTDSQEGYWLVRNSWGEEWGEGGYIRLSVGNATCAVDNDPTFSKPVLLTR